MTKLILGGFKVENIKQIDPEVFSGIELDLQYYFSLTLAARKRFKHWIQKTEFKIILKINLRRHASDSLLEGIAIWEEEWKDRTLSMMISSGYRSWDLERDTQKIALLTSFAEIQLECGKDENHKELKKIETKHVQIDFVLDLDWHRTLLKKFRHPEIYKIHGWNEVRWVRRYGELKINSMKKLLGKKVFLILAYSGRFEEAQKFKEILC